jgi:D-sedoheptulose 7-phosphate isomerase
MPETPSTPVAATNLDALHKLLDAIDVDAVERLVERLRLAREQRATVFVAGNGGSAATASHWVNDLCKATRADGRPSIRAVSLTDNASWVTALANDEGYDRVFAGQLENFAQDDDVLVVISASGNSPNLVRAVETARARGVTTMALLGFDGGILKEAVDDFVWLPTEVGAYGLAETGHSAVTDIVTSYLIADSRSDRNQPRR